MSAGNDSIGSAVHAMSSKFISEFVDQYPMKPAKEKWTFFASRYASDLTETVCACINLYFRQVTQVWYTEKYKNHHPRLFLEYPLRTSRFTGKGNGRADAMILTPSKVWLFDLKTGENPASFQQLKIYALAVIRDFGLSDNTDFELTIVQPNRLLSDQQVRSERWTAKGLKEAQWRYQDYPALLEFLNGSVKERLYMRGD